MCIEIIGGNCTAMNLRIAEIYENKYDKSMAKALTRSPKEKLVFALQAGHHVQRAILGGPLSSAPLPPQKEAAGSGLLHRPRRSTQP